MNWNGWRLERLPGTVLLPDGSPACGARVIWSVGTPGYCMVPAHPIIAGATTDASGHFSIEQPEGGYVDSGGLHPRLHVSLPGFATQEIPAVAIPKQGDIEVRLLPEAWIRGCVVDQAGAPVVAVLVRLCDPSTRGAPVREAVPWFLTREAIASVYTKGDGRFEVRAVPAGRYDLEFLTFRGPGGLRGPRWLTTVLDADGTEPLEVRVKRPTRAKADEPR